MTHSLYSPSSLHRRLICLGSANAERDMPDTSSEVSAEGTAAHHIREQCLLTGKDVTDFVGTTVDIEGFSFEVTQEWVRFLQPGIDHLRDIGSGIGIAIEHFVDLSPWMPGEGGTLDARVSSTKLHTINDLKFGRSPVSAERNPQGMAYGLGSIYQCGITDPNLQVAIEIDQPRVFGGGSRWVTTVGELLEFGEQLREMYQLSQDPNAPRTPSFDACTYCKANTQCRELADYIFDILGIRFEGIRFEGSKMIQSDEQLDNDKLAVIVSNASLISKMIESYKNRAKDLILSEGVDLPGVKVISGAGRREWVNAEDVEAWLLTKYKKHQIYKSELISPAQAENVLGTRNWAKVQEFIRTSEGNPTLVSAEDPRPALIPAINLFDVVDDEFDALFGDVTDDLDDILG